MRNGLQKLRSCWGDFPLHSLQSKGPGAVCGSLMLLVFSALSPPFLEMVVINAADWYFLVCGGLLHDI